MKNTTQSELFQNANIAQLTPMMQQYLKIKEAHQEYLLFYRMGDFYELFFNDAIVASNVLDIVLTKRGKHLAQDIPMCGVPAHSCDQYLSKLIKAGYKVAVCEQLETPEEAKKRGNKSVVLREVTRIITSGTIIEEHLLNAKQSNFLAAIVLYEGQLAIAWVEATTGEFYYAPSSMSTLAIDLVRFNPKEIIISDKFYSDTQIKSTLFEFQKILTVRSSSVFDLLRCEKRIQDFYKIISLKGIGTFSKCEIIAVGVLIEYLEHTHKSNLPRLINPKKIATNHFMIIDSSTRRNLEIECSINGDRKHSLIGIIDYTLTAIGGRLLNLYLSAPLCNAEALNQRLDNVDFFIQCHELRKYLRNIFKHFPDLERALSRVFIKKAGPRDLGLIRDALNIALSIAQQLLSEQHELPSSIRIQVANIANFNNILQTLNTALKNELPFNLHEGRFLNSSYNPQLDELYELKSNAQVRINQLKEKYAALTGIVNLKISYNNVMGYFIDITPAQGSKVKDDLFIHKQTLGSSIRYTTKELQSLEMDIINVDTKIGELEQELFYEICEQVIGVAEHIALTAQAIAALDLYSSFAELAIDNHYVRPIIDDSRTFYIEGGRHPIVEKALNQKFIANSCSLDTNTYLWLITGPNMAGKSTFLRQNALICIMAQIGCFVPAKRAEIGIVDRLFSRVGAGDDISRGQSTFMVEMVETAAILNNATAKSLVILDEIGRGTATYDGLSIAWSVVENLHNKLKCRTQFATHYHELTDLENVLPHLACYTANIKEWEGKVIFLHEVIKGKADRSYGVHVAELAGLPKDVIQRANEILSVLQAKEKVSLNIVSAPANENSNNTKLVDELKNIDIDSLTPKDAFNIIYNMKSKLS
jgi:DNA mismatch repair protein MutS